MNWGRAVRQRTDVTYTTNLSNVNRLFGSLDELELEDEIVVRPGDDLGAARYDGQAKTLYYPALSVPLGEADELVCPAAHVEHVTRRLRELDGINVLVIGYSGLDKEVLSLLAESDNALRSLLVVSDSRDRAETTAEIIKRQFGSTLAADFVTDGFKELVATGRLAAWLDRVARQ